MIQFNIHSKVNPEYSLKEILIIFIHNIRTKIYSLLKNTVYSLKKHSFGKNTEYLMKNIHF